MLRQMWCGVEPMLLGKGFEWAQLAAKHTTGPEKDRSDGRDRGVEDSRNFGGSKATAILEDDYLLIPLRESVECGYYLSSILGFDGEGFGARLRRIRNDLLVCGESGLECFVEGAGSHFASEHAALVGRDGVQPGTDRGFAPEAVDLLGGLHQ